MIHVYHDGGKQLSCSGQRQKYDCGVRSLANAAGVFYEEAFQALKTAGRRSNCGTHYHHMRKAIHALGFEIKPAGRRGTVRRFLEHRGAKGNFVVGTGSHFTAIIDGRIWDTLWPDQVGRMIVERAWQLIPKQSKQQPTDSNQQGGK